MIKIPKDANKEHLRSQIQYDKEEKISETKVDPGMEIERDED